MADNFGKTTNNPFRDAIQGGNSQYTDQLGAFALYLYQSQGQFVEDDSIFRNEDGTYNFESILKYTFADPDQANMFMGLVERNSEFNAMFEDAGVSRPNAPEVPDPKTFLPGQPGPGTPPGTSAGFGGFYNELLNIGSDGFPVTQKDPKKGKKPITVDDTIPDTGVYGSGLNIPASWLQMMRSLRQGGLLGTLVTGPGGISDSRLNTRRPTLIGVGK